MRFFSLLNKEMLGQQIGHGFQGKVFAVSDDAEKVMKRFPLEKKRDGKIVDMSAHTDKTIEFSKKASAIGVGPTIYGDFISEDGKYRYLIMDRIIPGHPQASDALQIQDLYETLMKHHLVPFDSEFGYRVRPDGTKKWMIFDYGVTKEYPTYQKALVAAVAQDLFADVGMGFYSPSMEKYFVQKAREEDDNMLPIAVKQQQTQQTNYFQQTSPLDIGDIEALDSYRKPRQVKTFVPPSKKRQQAQEHQAMIRQFAPILHMEQETFRSRFHDLLARVYHMATRTGLPLEEARRIFLLAMRHRIPSGYIKVDGVTLPLLTRWEVPSDAVMRGFIEEAGRVLSVGTLDRLGFEEVRRRPMKYDEEYGR